MKTVMGWLTDPYLHVVLAAALLVGLASRSGTGDPTEGFEFVEVTAERLTPPRPITTGEDAKTPAAGDVIAGDRGR